MVDFYIYIPELIFLLPLLLGGLRGYNHGITLQLISLMSMLVLFYGFTFIFYAFSRSFFEWFAWDIVNTELVITILFSIIIILIVHIFVRMLFDNFTDKSAITNYSRLMGFFLGAIRYAFIISIFYNIYNQYSPIEKNDSWFRESRENSVVYDYNTELAPFIFNYLRFSQNRDIEYVKFNNIKFSGLTIPIEKTINYLCDSTKYAVWKFKETENEEPNKDSSVIEVKIAFDDTDNLNTFTFNFLLLKKDSLIFLDKYLENQETVAKNKGFEKLSNAFMKMETSKSKE